MNIIQFNQVNGTEEIPGRGSADCTCGGRQNRQIHFHCRDLRSALFAAAGLPVEAIILLSPISSIADMARTATNVVGAAAATTLVAATEGQLDKAVYNGEVEAPAAEAV